MRKDKLRTARNERRETAMKKLIKAARNSQNPKALQAAFSALDKAAKVKLIHPNKAARLKSRLSKLVGSSPQDKAKATPTKKVTKKTSTRKTSK